MLKSKAQLLAALFLALALLLPQAAHALPHAAPPAAAAIPDGFVEERVVAGLKLPTSFAVAPDGRIYVTEKNGMVRVVVDGELLPDPFIDLTNEVNDAADRGLMSVALHPRFPAQPYVYLAYTYDPPEARAYSAAGARVARVLRIEADRADLNTHKPGTGVVILGANSTFEHIGNPDQGDTEPFSCYNEDGSFVQDCLATEGTAHTIDFLRFARDGSLFVSMGDGIVNSKGNWRAQDPNSLNGKILRIDPMTGNGYANNPFYDGDVTANRAKVYALGLRNPFRFTFHPTTGAVVVGEVGNNTWEEINQGGPGANFGWPCYEGEEKMSDWEICQPLFDGAAPVTWGLHTYPHSAQPSRGAAIGGDFYTGRNFPAAYRNAYFFSDFNGGVVWVMTFSRSGVPSVRDFATSVPGPIQITTGPDGTLWMLYIATGEIARIRWLGSAAPATPTAAATPRAGATAAAAGAAAATAAASGTITATLPAPAAPRATPAGSAPAGEGSGSLLREVWKGVSGKTVADLTTVPGFPATPSERGEMTSFDAPREGNFDYGQRIRGYIHPPVSGPYTFWIASDDGSVLKLSSDESPANAVIIASVPEWTPYQVWDKYAEQISGPVELEAGRKYFVEVLHKQADQKENLSVAWQIPGEPRAVIAGEYLSPLQ